MKYSKNHQGFAVAEALLALVILAIIGFVGYKVMNDRNSVDQNSKNVSSVQPETATSSVEAPVVNSTADLNMAQQALDSENPDDNSSDSTQLDSQLATF